MQGQRRWLIAAGALAAIVVLFVLFRGRDGGEGATTATATTSPGTAATTPPPATTAAAPEPTVVHVTVRDGKVVEGPKVYELPFRKRVTLVVTSDVADEVHLHGYDVMGNVAPGRPVRLTFVTRLSGRFELELENAHLGLGEVSVLP